MLEHDACTTDDRILRYSDYKEEIKDRMLRAHEVARRYLKSNAARNKEAHDANAAYNNYEPGDLV